MSEIPLVQKASLQSSFGAPEEIFTAWRESISPYFDSQPLFEVGEAPPIALNASQYHLGCALFYDSVFSRQKFVRDTRWGVQHDDADHVLLQVWEIYRRKTFPQTRPDISLPFSVISRSLMGLFPLRKGMQGVDLTWVMKGVFSPRNPISLHSGTESGRKKVTFSDWRILRFDACKDIVPFLVIS